jgi:hypothetical protein
MGGCIAAQDELATNNTGSTAKYELTPEYKAQ